MDISSPNLIIKQLEIGTLENFVYILADKNTREGIIVDPAWEPNEIIQEAEVDDINITKVFVTHIHTDHINAVKEVSAYYGCEVYINNLESSFICDPALNIISTYDEDTIMVGDVAGECIHTPGHSPGSQCLLIDGVLITGDTLFIDACGRTDLPGGDMDDLYYSLNERLKNLDDKVIVLPGHNYGRTKVSTIAQEKENNLFMRPNSIEEFRRLFQRLM